MLFSQPGTGDKDLGATSPERRHRPQGDWAQAGASAGTYQAGCLPQPAVCRLGGAEEAAARRRIHVDDAATVARLVAAASVDRTAYSIEYRRMRSDNSIAFVQESGFFGLEPDADGYATIVDVSARRQSEEANWRAAHYDELTDLPNRTYLLRRIGDAVREAAANDRIAAVLVSNVDKFRETNDMFGFETCDQLLRMLAMRLSEFVCSRDVVARLGGDWFAVLLADVDSRSLVADTTKRLMAAVAQPFVIDGRQYHLTLSIGIGVAPSDSSDPIALIRAAYTALRAAKASGCGGLRWYERAMSVDAANNARQRTELHAALENGELVLHYQPIVDVAQDRIVAVEALVRWNHPTRGLLQPLEFIGLADRTGLIVPLGEWVLREACRQACEWRDLGFDLRVCINVSPVQFRQPNFVALAASILAEYDLAPDRVELELTESVMIDGLGDMMEKLSQLTSWGLRLAIDDFGTGYSSLAYLKNFPVNTLKIDRAFVTDIAAGRFDRAIATTVLTLANELGLDCIAEGVENAEQLDTLRAIGCTVMQGYYFCRPTTPARLRPILGASVATLRGATTAAALEEHRPSQAGQTTRVPLAAEPPIGRPDGNTVHYGCACVISK